MRELILKMSMSIDGFVGSPLITAGLVDQYALLVHPVALGKGLPVFSDLATPRRLRLESSKAFPKGAVAQIYRPA
jgi:dihydrofolate reductase